MDRLEALPIVQAGFQRRLAEVQPEQWSAPTPCDEWTVRDLVNHAVAGARMYKAMLEGCSREMAAELLESDVLGDSDPLLAFREAAEEVAEAFRAPGAFERICRHPTGDWTGYQLLGIRIADDLVHTWDLARAIGGDEALGSDVVEAAWDVVEPILDRIGPDNGMKDGPSGKVGVSAPLQDRLLDSLGRRPDTALR